jgi:hypothetical protein
LCVTKAQKHRKVGIPDFYFNPISNTLFNPPISNTLLHSIARILEYTRPDSGHGFSGIFDPESEKSAKFPLPGIRKIWKIPCP